MPRRFGKLLLSLQGRVTLLIAAIAIGSVVSTAGLDLAFTAHKARWFLRERAKQDATVVTQFAAPQVGTGDASQLHDELGAIVARGGFVRFDVVDLANRYTYDALSGQVRLNGTPGALATRAIAAGGMVTEEADGLFHLALPGLYHGQPVVVVDLVVSLSLQPGRLVEMVGVALGTVLLLVAIFVPLGLLLARRIVLPLRRVTMAARRLREGDLTLDALPDEPGEIGELVTTLNGMVSHVRQDTSEIRRLAFVDTVTRLCNRERFRAILALALEAADAMPRALLLVDLDHFKAVNDVHGQLGGDQVLATVAQRLSEIVEAHGFTVRDPVAPFAPLPPALRLATMGRQAGDEFVVLLRGHRGAGELAALAAAFGAAGARAIELDGGTVELSASVGVVEFGSDCADASQLMRYADLATQAAKAAGRGRHVVFTPDLDQRARDRVVLEMEIRKAIGLKEFRVHYMLKVPLSGGECHGVEALVRWQHPRRGLLSPAAFIELAEESGLIVEIDRLVLDEACRQAAVWAKAGWPMAVAVNISRREFQRPDFVDAVLSTLERHDLDPALLELEMTESMAMGNPTRVAAIVTQLRAVGIRFAIDDFGTGYSNLGQLTTLSFDVLKIDQSFVRALGERADASMIIETIISLAQNLGVETVAEGVETAEQAAFLEGHGCTLGQGYYFGRPMPPEDVERLFLPERMPSAGRTGAAA